jgi:hypothetical protein
MVSVSGVRGSSTTGILRVDRVPQTCPVGRDDNVAPMQGNGIRTGMNGVEPSPTTTGKRWMRGSSARPEGTTARPPDRP